MRQLAEVALIKQLNGRFLGWRTHASDPLSHLTTARLDTAVPDCTGLLCRSVVLLVSLFVSPAVAEPYPHRWSAVRTTRWRLEEYPERRGSQECQ